MWLPSTADSCVVGLALGCVRLPVTSAHMGLSIGETVVATVARPWLNML